MSAIATSSATILVGAIIVGMQMVKSFGMFQEWQYGKRWLCVGGFRRSRIIDKSIVGLLGSLPNCQFPPSTGASRLMRNTLERRSLKSIRLDGIASFGLLLLFLFDSASRLGFDKGIIASIGIEMLCRGFSKEHFLDVSLLCNLGQELCQYRLQVGWSGWILR